MPAAAAEAPVGNHHVLAMKKYALANVISQMTRSKMRPIYRDLPTWNLPGSVARKNLELSLTNSPAPNRRESIIPLWERKRVLEHAHPRRSGDGAPCWQDFARSNVCRLSAYLH